MEIDLFQISDDRFELPVDRAEIVVGELEILESRLVDPIEDRVVQHAQVGAFDGEDFEGQLRKRVGKEFQLADIIQF